MTTRPMTALIVYAETMVEPLNLTRTRYTSLKLAQNAAKRLNAKRKAAGWGGSTYKAYTIKGYQKAIAGKGEWKVSPFTGAKVWVAMGTPACCDPTTETYMSM